MTEEQFVLLMKLIDAKIESAKYDGEVPDLNAVLIIAEDNLRSALGLKV